MAGPRSRRQPIRNSSTSTCHDFLVGGGSCGTKGTRPYLVLSDKTLSDIVQLNPHEAGGGSFQQQGMLYYRIQRQGSPIGVGMGPHIFSTLFCEFVLILPHPFSTVATTSHPVTARFSPSQLFSSQQLKFFHLLAPQLNSFHLFPSLVNSSRLCPPLLNSSPLFAPHLNSSQPSSILLTSCQLLSTLFTFSHLSQFFSTTLTSCHLFSTLLASSHLCPTLLHTKNFYIQQDFTQRSFYTQNAQKLSDTH